MAFEPDAFQQAGYARLTPAGGTTFVLRVVDMTHTIERRVIPRKRPGLDGAPLDDTGAEADVFAFNLLFARSDTALQSIVNEAIYPTFYTRFLRAVRVEGTASMYIPGRGDKRVRVRRIDTRQNPNEREAENVTLNVVEDLEDPARAGADTFTAPSAKSSPRVYQLALAASAGPVGWGGDLLYQLGAAIDRLQAVIDDPLSAAGDIGQRADRVLDLCRKMRRLHTAPVQPFDGGGYAPLRATDAFEPLALLARIEDAASAQRAAVFGTATTRPRRFNRVLSIFDIATELGQPVADLIRLNGRLPLFGIPAGTEVIVKAA